MEGRRPLNIPARLIIERFGAREVRISGGDSPHTADRPFVIDLDEVREGAHVLDWMSRIAVRCWGATPADLFTLARLLLDAIGERQEPSADA